MRYRLFTIAVIISLAAGCDRNDTAPHFHAGQKSFYWTNISTAELATVVDDNQLRPLSTWPVLGTTNYGLTDPPDWNSSEDGSFDDCRITSKAVRDTDMYFLYQEDKKLLIVLFDP